MTTNIIFTCPACGSHELTSIQQAVHRTPITLMRTAGGEWSGIPSGSIQELHGSTLGYRCSSCRYPDVPNHDTNGGFHWQTLDHVAAAGVLCTPGDAPLPAISAAILASHHAPAGTVHRVEDT